MERFVAGGASVMSVSISPNAEREWRLLAADGDECWAARRGMASEVGAHPEGRLYEVVLYGNASWNEFTVALPAIPIQRARLVELRDRLAGWLALPVARWATEPFEATAKLSDGPSGTFELTWGPSKRWIVSAGATVATCRFEVASLAVHHGMVVDPTCLGLFHGELSASLERS